MLLWPVTLAYRGAWLWAYDVDVPTMSLEQHERGIHVVCQGGESAGGQRGAAEKKAPARVAAESRGVLPDSIAAIAMSPR